MDKKLRVVALAVGLLLVLAGCSAPQAEPQDEPKAQEQGTGTATTVTAKDEPTQPAAAETPKPAPNAGKPLPNSNSISQLKTGELLYSTEYSSDNAGQILVSFVLSADGKKAHSFNAVMRDLTVIYDPDTAPRPAATESVTIAGALTVDVTGGRLTFDDNTLKLSLAIDGDYATGSCSISYYNAGFKFTDDMPLVEGITYTDVPPSSIAVAEQPVEFAVAARGATE
ncbi:MAG: hypothetical protein LBD25_02900 [Coriobacteriales bacterium]|jgi:hypothetical protein|nr:hypothetical protein [Coriobacteriales bacterium]